MKVAQGKEYPTFSIEAGGSDAQGIVKHGFLQDFSWEALTNDTRKGEYVPAGNKTLQRIGWFWGLLKYKAYRKLESSLEKSRHFQGVGGYDWEEAEYREFKQKTKWVEEDSNVD